MNLQTVPGYPYLRTTLKSGGTVGTELYPRTVLHLYRYISKVLAFYGRSRVPRERSGGLGSTAETRLTALNTCGGLL